MVYASLLGEKMRGGRGISAPHSAPTARANITLCDVEKIKRHTKHKNVKLETKIEKEREKLRYEEFLRELGDFVAYNDVPSFLIENLFDNLQKQQMNMGKWSIAHQAFYLGIRTEMRATNERERQTEGFQRLK